MTDNTYTHLLVVVDRSGSMAPIKNDMIGGHNLFADEICGSCGCNAQRFPRSAKVRFDECDHEIMWCWVCSITPDMRPSSVGIAMRHADSDELGEWVE